ncbi:mitochondrial import receptor subunit TOM22 homolog [Tachypleus tridentatus]|uniref:mitochondrial import receptor subunit TOM22 homolog n=1 Tax=Tachypleus tridentatus TaxID=6853 RepID=UPI003FD56FAD
MASEEGESGFELMNAPENSEESPQIKKEDKEPEAGTSSSSALGSGGTVGLFKTDDDDDLDESLGERLWGLTEMFPETLRSTVWSVMAGTVGCVKWCYGFSRSAFWIFFSSSAILVAPVIFEIERMQMEEMQKQQQRQILLGPSAAVSSSSGMGMMMPGPQQPSQH